MDPELKTIGVVDLMEKTNCGGHAVTAIGYKCTTSNELLILIQNSSGTNFCRENEGSITGFDVKVESFG